MNESSDLVCKFITGLIFMSSIGMVVYKIVGEMDYLDKVFCGALLMGSLLTSAMLMMVGGD